MAAKIGSGSAAACSLDGAPAKSGAASAGADSAGITVTGGAGMAGSTSAATRDRRVIERGSALAMDLSSVAWVRPVAVLAHCDGPLVEENNATYNDENCQPSL